MALRRMEFFKENIHKPIKSDTKRTFGRQSLDKITKYYCTVDKNVEHRDVSKNCLCVTLNMCYRKKLNLYYILKFKMFALNQNRLTFLLKVHFHDSLWC